MSKHLYKQYIRVVSKWPKDANKSAERDFANFLKKDAERQFQVGQAVDSVLAEKRINALEQLLNNEVMKKFPHNYSSGVFGMKLADLQAASSEESRKQMGLKPKDNIIKKAWRSVFPAKK